MIDLFISFISNVHYYYLQELKMMTKVNKFVSLLVLKITMLCIKTVWSFDKHDNCHFQIYYLQEPLLVQW